LPDRFELSYDTYLLGANIKFSVATNLTEEESLFSNTIKVELAALMLDVLFIATELLENTAVVLALILPEPAFLSPIVCKQLAHPIYNPFYVVSVPEFFLNFPS
jgi:hypothetical protein